MSRMGTINAKIQQAQENESQPEFSDSELRWIVEWEQWRLLELSGYDVGEVQARYGAGTNPAAEDPYNTAGVPRGGANDREMRLGENGPETVVQDDEESADEDAPYSEWKVDDLRAELTDRQLPADGKKADLVARLEADDAEATE
jgi:hypothetical protein